MRMTPGGVQGWHQVLGSLREAAPKKKSSLTLELSQSSLAHPPPPPPLYFGPPGSTFSDQHFLYYFISPNT